MYIIDEAFILKHEKQHIQADSEVGAVPNVTASCIARAVAQFVERLVKETQGAARGGKRKIDASHMYVDAYINNCLILTPRPCDGLASRHRARRTLPGQHIPPGMCGVGGAQVTTLRP